LEGLLEGKFDGLVVGIRVIGLFEGIDVDGERLGLEDGAVDGKTVAGDNDGKEVDGDSLGSLCEEIG
jgi:hypothetical protein